MFSPRALAASSSRSRGFAALETRGVLLRLLKLLADARDFRVSFFTFPHRLRVFVGALEAGGDRLGETRAPRALGTLGHQRVRADDGSLKLPNLQPLGDAILPRRRRDLPFVNGGTSRGGRRR